jgi:DNA-directed RNA polymerase, mitochondrial
MIHDSYGTLAADAPVLARTLRESFVRMYEHHDPLRELRNDIRTKWPEIDLPELPPKGTLDISAVLHSPYFFA